MKNETVKFRISEDELSRWQAQANKEGTSLSSWIRSKCNAEPVSVATNECITPLQNIPTPPAQTPKPPKPLLKPTNRFWKIRCNRCERLDNNLQDCANCKAQNL